MSDPSLAGPVRPHPVLERYYRDESGRRPWVTAAFDRSAPHYQRIDRLLSFGSGGRYRREALVRAGLAPGMRVLEVAVGPGPVAREARRIVGPAGSVVGLDPSLGMLRECRRTLGPAGPSLVRTIAEALPVRERSFDFLSMGYALRHVADLRVTFREYRRVLRPGGRLLLLEITRPESAPARALLRFYLRRVVPTVVRVGTRSADAVELMRYYSETVDRCLPPAAVLSALEEAGFVRVQRAGFLGFLSEYRALRSHG